MRGYRNGVTIVELAVVVSVFLAMLVVLAPFVRMAKQHVHRVECATNLMHISLGLHAYAADHEGAFPPDLKSLYPDYVSEEAYFDCPETKRHGTAANPDYDYTAGLTEDAQGNEIIVQDKVGNHHSSDSDILRVSGAVEWVRGR